MTTVGDLVNEVRSLLRGSLSDELSILDHDYNPGDPTIALRYPKINLSAGAMLSVGLNTFYAMAVDSTGTTVAVQPGADGGPTVVVPAGQVIRIRPAHTTWAIFREWCSEVQALSSPQVGLYAEATFDAPPDYKNNVYYLPTDVPPWNTMTPVRVLQARYQHRGYDQWQKMYGVEWQVENGVIRVYGLTPDAVVLRFVFAFPYGQPTDLTTDIATLGLTQVTCDIPGLGVAATLALTDEARRNQIAPQGDPRRPTEVPPGANVNVSRMFGVQQQQRIMQEAARLQALYGYAQMTGVSGEGTGWWGTERQGAFS